MKEIGTPAIADVVLIGIMLIVALYIGIIPSPIHPTTTTQTTIVSSTTSTGATSFTTTTTSTTIVSTTTVPAFAGLSGRRIGFWVSDDDIFSGDTIFGIPSPMTPTQFFNNYFMTPPYPATLLWVTGMSPSGPISETPAQDSQWIAQVAAIADQHPNIKIQMIFFLNLSGYSVLSGVRPPAVSTGLSNVGFTIARQQSLTSFTIASSAGLTASTPYNLELFDINMAPIAFITSFTTDVLGAWSGVVGVPNTTDAQAAAGGYIVVQNTHVGVSTGWQNDQSADFVTYATGIRGHSSIVGGLFEPEYFGDTPQIRQTFATIINNAGYYSLAGSYVSGATAPVFIYSSYPYFNGALQSSLSTNQYFLGIHYGETGSPDCTVTNPCPIWTQPTVLSIVDNSSPLPCTIIISEMDTNNPNGANYLWSSAGERAWITADANYQANYLKANG